MIVDKDRLTAALLIFSIILIGCCGMAIIDLSQDAEEIDALKSQVKTVMAINDDLAAQLDEAKRQIAEAVTADAPTLEEADETNSADIDILARLIMCEIGSDGHPDEQLYNVGSVILNRVSDSRFPDTVRGVIYQSSPCWQYAPARDGTLKTVKPTERCYTIANDLLSNGSRLPASVVWQSTTPQGSVVYAAYYSPVIGTTTYYCE